MKSSLLQQINPEGLHRGTAGPVRLRDDLQELTPNKRILDILSVGGGEKVLSN